MRNAVFTFAAVTLLVSASVEPQTLSGPVMIESLEVSGIDYTLIVTPSDRSNWEEWGKLDGCKRLTFRGTYQEVADVRELTLDAHRTALDYLRKAFEERRPVKIRRMQTSALEGNLRCEYRSHALLLVEDDDHSTVVLSVS